MNDATLFNLGYTARITQVPQNTGGQRKQSVLNPNWFAQSMVNLPKPQALTVSQLQPFTGDRSQYLGTVDVASLAGSNLLSQVDSAKFSQSVTMSPKDQTFDNRVSIVFEGI